MELTLLNNIITRNNDYTHLRNSKNINKGVEKAAHQAQTNNVSKDTVKIEVSNLLSELKGRESRSIETQNNINILKKADDMLDKTSAQIERIKELSSLANKTSLSKEEEKKLSDEVKACINNLDEIADSANFNKIQLLGGSKEELQINIDKEESLNIKDIIKNAKALGFNKDENMEVKNLINTVDNALNIINTQRSEIETYQNKLSSSIKPLKTSTQINDAKIANLSADIAKQNILKESLMNLTMQINANPVMAMNLLAA